MPECSAAELQKLVGDLVATGEATVHHRVRSVAGQTRCDVAVLADRTAAVLAARLLLDTAAASRAEVAQQVTVNGRLLVEITADTLLPGVHVDHIGRTVNGATQAAVAKLHRRSGTATILHGATVPELCSHVLAVMSTDREILRAEVGPLAGEGAAFGLVPDATASTRLWRSGETIIPTEPRLCVDDAAMESVGAASAFSSEEDLVAALMAMAEQPDTTVIELAGRTSSATAA